MVELDAAINAAIRAGALVRYEVALETGQFVVRRLWVRPEIMNLLNSARLDPDQAARVRAMFKRYVLGGEINVVTAQCSHREVNKLGDIRELKTKSPPFVEVRVKPPKHDLRFFGRFVGRDALILSTFGMKSLDQNTGTKTLSVHAELGRSDAIFRTLQIDLAAVPKTIQDSITKAKFMEARSDGK